jgi:hypothetical protein
MTVICSLVEITFFFKTSLFVQIDAYIRLPFSVLIVLLPPKHLEMIQDWTPPATVLLRELCIRGRPKISSSGGAPEANLFPSEPIFFPRTHDLPIIAFVSLTLAIAKARNFMLFTQRAFNSMSVKIVIRIQMRKTNRLHTFDRFTEITRGSSIRLSDLPKSIVSIFAHGCGDKLLS